MRRPGHQPRWCGRRPVETIRTKLRSTVFLGQVSSGDVHKRSGTSSSQDVLAREGAWTSHLCVVSVLLSVTTDALTVIVGSRTLRKCVTRYVSASVCVLDKFCGGGLRVVAILCLCPPSLRLRDDRQTHDRFFFSGSKVRPGTGQSTSTASGGIDGKG